MKRIILAILILASVQTAFAANELRIDYPTGATIIAVVTNDAGQYWDTAGAAFETFNTLTDYDIALTDAGGGSYRGNMPALPAGTYTIKYYASSVHFATEYNYNWSGTAKIDYIARIGDPNSGDTLAGDLAVIEAMVDDIGAAGAGLSAIPWNAAWDAEVESEVEDGIADANVPTAAGVVTAVKAMTIDGVDFESLCEMILAYQAGKATVTNVTSTGRTITYYKQNGTTVKFTITNSAPYNARSSGATIDP